jgi:hypothetical protein
VSDVSRPASGRVSPELRRTFALTTIAVAFSAVCAFAVSPKIVYLSRALGRGMLGMERGFTPVPRPSDSTKYDSEGGVPGTYCPIPARTGGESSVSTPPIPGTTNAPQISSAATPADGSNDLLLPPPATKCLVPAAPPSGRAIVP